MTLKNQIHLLLICTSLAARGQGTFIYDQQSDTNETPDGFATGGAMQQIPAPWGQSFTPSLSGIDFIRLKLNDGNALDGLGATVYLNLTSDSITGTVIGVTAPVTMPNLFTGTPTFLFSNTVPVSPGVTYFFEPILQSGGTWYIDSGEYRYHGGTAWDGGVAQPMSQFWFREGIVPEPGSGLLFLLGGGLLAALGRTRVFRRR
jgi:hypothetical protein